MALQILRALILGPPGSGKGTISSRIVRDFGLLHLSSGDLLRSQMGRETKDGLAAKKYIEEGKLVPDELVIRLLIDELITLKKSYLLDGKILQLHALQLNSVNTFSLLISQFHKYMRLILRDNIHTQVDTQNVNLTFVGGWVSGFDVFHDSLPNKSP